MSLIHPSSLGVRLTPMDNFEPKATGDWGLGTGNQGQRGQEIIIEEVSSLSPPNTQSPKPNPQSPIPKTQLFLYLIPIVGFFPSLWTLYRGQGSREQLAVSRLSITLALTWLLGYLLLSTGATTSDSLSLRLFILNSFLTSGYFIVSVWLILRLIKGKSGRLPGFSTLAERVFGK
ncbi:hypothetical protein [Nostoc sp.]|uniref:hypothetical protein n=1 Tax=Nostoc sp. TaxID=1180 RepID=UPI003FA543A6